MFDGFTQFVHANSGVLMAACGIGFALIVVMFISMVAPKGSWWRVIPWIIVFVAGVAVVTSNRELFDAMVAADVHAPQGAASGVGDLFTWVGVLVGFFAASPVLLVVAVALVVVGLGFTVYAMFG